MPVELAAQASDPAPDPVQAVQDPLVATQIVAPPGGLRVLRLPHGASPLVALRLFVPIQETPAEAGSGWILARMARERISEAARRLGAEVEVTRTPDGIAYAVSGPLSDFDYLSYLLRVATEEPEARQIESVQRELDDALDRLTETGSGQTELGLRTRLGAIPTYGTPASVAQLSAARVLDLWSRSHRTDRMTLIVLGPVERPLLLASTVGLGSSDPTIPPVLDAPLNALELPRIDILRRYAGRAWSAPEAIDPQMAVLSRIAGELVRAEAGDFEAQVQLWETAGGSVLAVTGASFPVRFGELERVLDGLPAALGRALTPEGVARVATQLSGDVLAQANTPLGRVQLVGRFMDAWGTPDSARRYLDRLATMQVADLLDLIEGLGPAAAVTVR